MENIRAVVIGFGGMGSKYAKLLKEGLVEGMELTGICCRNVKGQATIHKEYPGVRTYQDAADTFAHEEEFDAVIIVTPHDTHVEIGKQAFAAGKHVICDKPAGIATREVKELHEKWQEAKTLYSMIFNTRTRAAFAKAKAMIEADELGTVTRGIWVCNTWYRTSAYHNSASWRSTWSGEHGGLLINQCQHYLDIWQWLLGMPDRVDASIDFGKYNNFQVDDSFDLRLLYDNGLRGSIMSASGETPATNRFEIWGTKGKLTIEGGKTLIFDKNVMETTEFNKINKECYGALAYESHVIPLEEEKNQYQILFQNISNHIRNGEPLICQGEDGLKALEIANGAYLSAWLGKTIELPIDDDLYMKMLNQKIEEEKNLTS